MRGRWQQVVKLVFKGQRFQDHALDLGALAELSQFQRMITETAKALWRAGNPDRKNLPSRFDERTRLCVRKIEEGSVAVPLELFFEEAPQKEMFESEPPIVEEAIRMARNVYRAVETDAPLPDGFPRSLVSEYEKWGETLGEDEAIEMVGNGHEPARVTPSVRSRLTSFMERSYEDQVDITGEVLEADVRHERFQIWPDEATSVTVQFAPDQENEVTAALRDHKTVRLQVMGRGEFSPQGKLARITAVEQLRLEPVGEVPYDATARPIEEVLAELAREVPEEEWNRLPPDLTDHLDHYIYGTPKR